MYSSSKNPFVFSKKQEEAIMSNCYSSSFVITQDKKILLSQHCNVIGDEVLFYKCGKEFMDTKSVQQLLYIHPN